MNTPLRRTTGERPKRAEKSQPSIHKTPLADRKNSSFIPQPKLCMTTDKVCHVNELLESLQSQRAAASAAVVPVPAAKETDTALVPAEHARTDAKHLHIPHKQQQQQMLPRHPALHSQISAALMSRPVPATSNAAANVMSRITSRTTSPIRAICLKLSRGDNDNCVQDTAVSR